MANNSSQIKPNRRFMNNITRTVTSFCINSTHAYWYGTLPRNARFPHCVQPVAVHLVALLFACMQSPPVGVYLEEKLTGTLSTQASDHISLETSSGCDSHPELAFVTIHFDCLSAVEGSISSYRDLCL